MNELNTDRYYDIPQHEDEGKLIGECGCGEEIYETHCYIEIDDEVFCDTVCVYDHFVKKNFYVIEVG